MRIAGIVGVPPPCIAETATVMGNPDRLLPAVAGDAFGESDLLKPFVPLMGAAVLLHEIA